MCHTQAALLRGYRPQLNCPTSARLVTKVCRRQCIYCDIWKLATLLVTHVPLTSRYNINSSSKMSSYSAQAAQMRLNLLKQHEVKIESALTRQRARLASIMSICVVEGADQSEGLRIAYDRCFEEVESLLYDEEWIEKDIVYSNAYDQRRSSGDSYMHSPATPYSSQQQQHQQPCAVAESYYAAERRPSYAVAM